MEEDGSHMTERILQLTLEITYLLSGQDYEVTRKPGGDVRSHDTGGRSRRPGPPASALKYENNNDKKVLELANRVIHLLSGEVWRYLAQEVPSIDTTVKDQLSSQGNDAVLENPANGITVPVGVAMTVMPKDEIQHQTMEIFNSNSTKGENVLNPEVCQSTHVREEPLSFEEHLSNLEVSRPTFVKSEPLSFEQHLSNSVVSQPTLVKEEPLSFEQHLSNSVVSQPTLVKEEPLSFDEHLPNPDAFQPALVKEVPLPFEEHLSHTDVFQATLIMGKPLPFEEHLSNPDTSQPTLVKEEHLPLKKHLPCADVSQPALITGEPLSFEEHLSNPNASRTVLVKEEPLPFEEHFSRADVSQATLIMGEPLSFEEHLSNPGASQPALVKKEPLAFEEHLSHAEVSTTGHPRRPLNDIHDFCESDFIKQNLVSLKDYPACTAFIIKEKSLQCEQKEEHFNLCQSTSPTESQQMSDELSTGSRSLGFQNRSYPDQPFESGSHYEGGAGVKADWSMKDLSRASDKPLDNWTGHKKRLSILQRGNVFSCSECGKSSARKAALLYHQHIHMGEKPYSCSVCGKCLTCKSQLILHLRTHTGEKPYSCSVCGKCFIRKSNLILHLRTHTGEKPYSCLECGKSFARRSHVISHKRVHTGERPYPCPECGKSFTSNSNLIRHRKAHHPPGFSGASGGSMVVKRTT